MKTVVEFGVRGGRWTSQVCNSIKDGIKLAEGAAWVLGFNEASLKVGKGAPRSSITNCTHFVSIALLDGSQAADQIKIWRKGT